MAGIIDFIRIMLENDVVRTAFVYYLVGIPLWMIYFLANKWSVFFNNLTKNQFLIKKCRVICFLALVAVSIALVGALNYVGFLPYGPDTVRYTYFAKTISKTGHWHALGVDPYYASYHTSACLLTLTTEILGSLQVAYSALLVAFLLSFLLILGGWASKMANVNSRCLGIIVATLLFMASPKLMGFDLLQQYIGLVYAAISVMILLVQTNIEAYLIFSLFAIVSVISHLSGALLMPILLMAALLFRRRRFISGLFIFSAIAAAYLLAASSGIVTAPHTSASSGIVTAPHMNALSAFLEKMFRGNPSEFVVHSLEETPFAKIALFSWTLLLSMASAYILLFLLLRLERRKLRTLTRNLPSFTAGKERSDKFTVILYAIALGYIFLGLLTRTTGVELFRYVVIPSYFMLVILSSATVTRFIAKNKGRTLRLAIFLILLTPYLYSAIHSPERAPWTSAIGFAPVTYTDRIEMLPLVRYAKDGYHIFPWLNAYLPFEEVENPPHLFSGRSFEPIYSPMGENYYSIYGVLKMVTRDKAVKVPANSLFVLHKNAVSSTKFKNYIIIFNGYQHFVVLPNR